MLFLDFIKINEEATKILRIIGLITKYPKSGLREFLYNTATNLSVDIDKLYLEAYDLKLRFLQSSTYASDIQKINNMVKETYQAASGLNAKIDSFVKNHQFEAILEEYKITICKNKIPALEKCEAIELESNLTELINLYFLIVNEKLQISEVDTDSLRNKLNDLMRKIKLNRELEKLQKNLAQACFHIRITISFAMLVCVLAMFKINKENWKLFGGAFAIIFFKFLLDQKNVNLIKDKYYQKKRCL